MIIERLCALSAECAFERANECAMLVRQEIGTTAFAIGAHREHGGLSLQMRIVGVRLRAMVPIIVAHPVTKKVIGLVTKRWLFKIGQAKQYCPDLGLLVIAEHRRREQMLTKICNQDFKALIPIAITVARRFIAKVFDRTQQLALHGIGLARFWHELLPDGPALVEILHAHAAAFSTASQIRSTTAVT
jgi:hypothetical protein